MSKADLYVTIKLWWLQYQFLIKYSRCLRMIITGQPIESIRYANVVQSMNYLYQLERKYHSWPMDVFDNIVRYALKKETGDQVWYYACVWNLTVFMRDSLSPHDCNGKPVTLRHDHYAACKVLLSFVRQEDTDPLSAWVNATYGYRV